MFHALSVSPVYSVFLFPNFPLNLFFGVLFPYSFPTSHFTFFNSTIGVQQGCPLSSTLFGLCIDELEEMATKFVKEECVEEVGFGNAMIMHLLYADDVVLFANTLGDAQKLMKALEIFCMHTKLSVNSSKTKIMLVKCYRTRCTESQV